jgi:predicted nucleotidyltransferase
MTMDADRENIEAFEDMRETILPVLLPYGVRQIALFGSVARGEDTPESDIDLLVEFEDPPRQPLGLMTWVRLERELTGRFGRRVDMVSARGVSRHLAPHIEAEKVVLYEQTG